MEVWQPHKRWVERSRQNAGYGRTGKPDPRALASSDSESGGQFPGSLLPQHWASASDLCAAGDDGASDPVVRAEFQWQTGSRATPSGSLSVWEIKPSTCAISRSTRECASKPVQPEYATGWVCAGVPAQLP